jgi:hypothetical protein
MAPRKYKVMDYLRTTTCQFASPVELASLNHRDLMKRVRDVMNHEFSLSQAEGMRMHVCVTER